MAISLTHTYLRAGLDQLALLVVEEVEAAAVLRASVVALAHPRRGVVRLCVLLVLVLVLVLVLC
jgi:hypothetical protein